MVLLETTRHQVSQRFWHDQPWSFFSSFAQDQGASQPSVLVWEDREKRIPSLDLINNSQNSWEKILVAIYDISSTPSKFQNQTIRKPVCPNDPSFHVVTFTQAIAAMMDTRACILNSQDEVGCSTTNQNFRWRAKSSNHTTKFLTSLFDIRTLAFC